MRNKRNKQRIIMALIAGAGICTGIGLWAEADDGNANSQAVRELQRQISAAGSLLQDMRVLLRETVPSTGQLRVARKRGRDTDAERARQERAASERAGELAALHRNLVELEKQLAEETRRAEDAERLRAQLEEMRRSRAETEKLLADMETNRVAQETRIRELKQNIQAAEQKRRELNDTARNLSRIQNDLQSERQRNEGLLRQIEKEAAELDSVEKEALQLERQLVEAQKESVEDKARHNEVAATGSRLEEVQSERAALEKQLAETVLRRREATSRRQDLINELELERERRAELQAQERAVEELDRRIAEQNKQNSEMEKTVAEQERIAVEIEDQVTAMREELAAMRKHVATQQRQTRDTRRVRRDLDKARTRHQAAERQMQTVLGKWEGLRREADELREELVVVTERSMELADELSALDALREETETLTALRDELNTRITEEEKEQRVAQKELRQLPRQIKDLNGVLKELAGQADTTLRELRSELQQEKEQRVELEKRLQALESGRVLALAAASRPDAPAAAYHAGDALAGESLADTERMLLEKARRSSRPEPDAGSAEAQQSLDPARRRADEHYQKGIQLWDTGDVDGAILEFKQTLKHDKEAAGAYYNLGVAFARQGDRSRACDYGYQAGLSYLRHDNRQQAMRMLLFIQSVDAGSPLVGKLRTAIARH